MKTNQNLTRQMGDFEVIQRTKDGMFNATQLLTQWNQASGMKKEIYDFFKFKNTKEFIQVLEKEEDLNTANPPYLKTRGKYGGTWMHPYLFVKFAMWINPKFEYHVIKFVYDELIRYRNDAGDAYRNLSSAMQRITPKRQMPVAMSHIAQALNYVVFGKHEREIRNNVAEESTMRELLNLEQYIAKAIKDGFLKSYEDVIQYLRREWHRKQTPEIFAA